MREGDGSRRFFHRLGRRLFGLGIAAGVVVTLTGCDGQGPRALILADASGPDHAAFIDGRAAAFKEQHGRAVRVLRIATGEAAVELAARGEADVAIVPVASPVDRFLSAEQGAQAGELDAGGARFRVLTVNPKQLPKVDPQGAALATFLVGAPPSRGAESR